MFTEVLTNGGGVIYYPPLSWKIPNFASMLLVAVGARRRWESRAIKNTLLECLSLSFPFQLIAFFVRTLCSFKLVEERTRGSKSIHVSFSMFEKRSGLSPPFSCDAKKREAKKFLNILLNFFVLFYGKLCIPKWRSDCVWGFQKISV